MTYESCQLEDLRVGDVLVNAGGQRWRVTDVRPGAWEVEDGTGKRTRFTRRRDYWKVMRVCN